MIVSENGFLLDQSVPKDLGVASDIDQVGCTELCSRSLAMGQAHCSEYNVPNLSAIDTLATPLLSYPFHTCIHVYEIPLRELAEEVLKYSGPLVLVQLRILNRNILAFVNRLYNGLNLKAGIMR